MGLEKLQTEMLLTIPGSLCSALFFLCTSLHLYLHTPGIPISACCCYRRFRAGFQKIILERVDVGLNENLFSTFNCSGIHQRTSTICLISIIPPALFPVYLLCYYVFSFASLSCTAHRYRLGRRTGGRIGNSHSPTLTENIAQCT